MGMCNRQRLRSDCTNAQPDLSLCELLKNSMSVKLLMDVIWNCKLKRRPHSLIADYTCQNATLVGISWLISSLNLDGDLMECVSDEVESTGTLITKYIIYAKTIQGLHLYLV